VRVVHIIKARGIAGAERHLLDLLGGLREDGVDARFVFLTEPNDTADIFEDAALVRGIPVQRLVLKHHFDPTIYGRLRKTLRELQPDIVHTHLFHADFYGIPIAKSLRVRTIITSRHNDDPRNGRFPFKPVQWVLWRMTTAGIAISKAVKRHSVEVEGAPANKIHVIYYGLPLPVEKVDKARARRQLREELHADEDAPLIGMICRLMSAKGIPDAFHAFAKIAPAFPTARFVLAGDGPMRGELEGLAKQLNLTGRIHFLGWRESPMQIAAGLDILLSPSVREGFGLTMLEAMAQGIPIIGSTASAIPEVVLDGSTGFTVPPRDPQKLSEAIRVMLHDKPLRMHMGLLGEERLETYFSAAHMVDETLNLYKRLHDKN
jgi:glycosyltransferase involved in cell wall biosynthesis